MANRNELRVSFTFRSTSMIVKLEKVYLQEKALEPITAVIQNVFPLELESLTIEELTVCFSLLKVQTVELHLLHHVYHLPMLC